MTNCTGKRLCGQVGDFHQGTTYANTIKMFNELAEGATRHHRCSFCSVSKTLRLLRRTDMTQHLNFVACPKCGKEVHDQPPACPYCHTKISVEDIGDIPYDSHRTLESQEREEQHGEEAAIRAERVKKD